MPTRLALTALLASVAFATGSSTTGRVVDGPGALARLERTDEAMGSWFGLVMYGPGRAELEAAADAAFEEVHRLDRLLSNYRPASEWSGVNRAAAARPVRVSPELFDLLSACLEYSRQSDGAFDITVGPLMKMWGFFRGEGVLPSGPVVTDALGRVGYRHVLLEAEGRTVRFLRPGIELDPGGIGKGYAVDRMVSVLREHGVGIALVSAAGSSIYGLGAPPGEPRGWRVPISDPSASSRSVADVYLKDLSISTSGSYEKFFWAEGRKYAHIIDPRTGYPARGASSVSVVAARAIDSEAWTKPYFVNGRAWTIANRRGDQRVLFCDDTPSAACSWIQ
jgi:thiamine biosynthesis lipoprotein